MPTHTIGLVHPFLTGARHPRVFAHRGLVNGELAAAGVAENTRAAFEAARGIGCEFIESDVWLTRDNVPVLWHDEDLKRLLGDPRRVAEIEYAELAELMTAYGGLLTLADALQEFPDTRFNLDIKTHDVAMQAGEILAPHADRVLVTSFDDANRVAALAAAKRASSQSRRGSRLPATSPGRSTLARLLLALGFGARGAAARLLDGFDAIQIPERQGPIRVLSRRLVEAAHASGVEVHVWTVNDPERMRELVEFGVDGIVTDRADLALAALGE